MNLDIFVLGTGGMMPLPGRGLTSVLLRREGDLLLFDCGEGTQIAFRRLNLKWKKITGIFISHTHADHVTGLPGMLSLSSQVDRDEPLYIYGPPRIRQFIEQTLRVLDIYINYEIIVHEFYDDVTVMEGDGYRVDSLRVRHTKPCLGYRLVEEPRPGQFHPERAVAAGVPRGPLWSVLQRGEQVRLDGGAVVEPAAVMGPPRPGRAFSFVTDTAAFPGLVPFVAGSDLLICEGMFCADLTADAAAKKHLTAQQAGRIARAAGVGRLGLIHYSPRYTERDLRQLVSEARAEFADSFLTRDLQDLSLPYRE